MIDSLTGSITFDGDNRTVNEINYPMEVYISASSNKLFLFGEDKIILDDGSYSSNCSITCSLETKFTFNGKSYTEEASLPSKDQLYKYTSKRNRIRSGKYITSDGYLCNYDSEGLIQKNSSTIRPGWFLPAIEFSL